VFPPKRKTADSPKLSNNSKIYQGRGREGKGREGKGRKEKEREEREGKRKERET